MKNSYLAITTAVVMMLVGCTEDDANAYYRYRDWNTVRGVSLDNASEFKFTYDVVNDYMYVISRTPSNIGSHLYREETYHTPEGAISFDSDTVNQDCDWSEGSCDGRQRFELANTSGDIIIAYHSASVDGGQSWFRDPLHTNAFGDEQYVVAGTTYESRDFGRTWLTMPMALDAEYRFFNGEDVYAGTVTNQDSTSFWITTDKGNNWEEHTEVSGIPTMHPLGDLIALFDKDESVIYYSEDLATTWHVIDIEGIELKSLWTDGNKLYFLGENNVRYASILDDGMLSDLVQLGSTFDHFDGINGEPVVTKSMEFMKEMTFVTFANTRVGIANPK
ncbi:WD40/YVTN/BNR-like repeat-containing protein [Vibrio astriarenae]